MTPKQKAKELYDKFFNKIDHFDAHWDIEKQAKQCALICVDEIIEEYDLKITVICYDYDRETWEEELEFWQEVKQEITNL